MRRAHQVDAARRETFYFRKFMAPPLDTLREDQEEECAATGSPNGEGAEGVEGECDMASALAGMAQVCM